MPRTRLTNPARSVTSPVRRYINEHFEAVKDVVRERSQAVEDSLLPRIDAVRSEATVNVTESIAAITELVDDRMRQVEALEVKVTELQATNDQLLAIVAELVKRPDGAATTRAERD
ncbi:MAG: hypothetical protein ACI83Y_002321 [Candidatus Azotimanducaceae bacterium]|jgi:hypothetical protein